MIVLAGCGGAAQSMTRTSAPRTSAPGSVVPRTVAPTGQRPSAQGTRAAGTPVPTTAAPAPTTAAPDPTLTALGAALTGALATAGPQSGAAIYDLTTHTTLYQLRADVAQPPASVEKLYTSIALLRALGPDVRLPTSVLGTGHLGRGGVWQGDLYLRGGGDPTFGDGGFNSVWEQGYGPTAVQLVDQLRRDGIRRVTGLVIGDASLFAASPGGPASGYAPHIPDYGGQRGALTYDHGSVSPSLSPGAFATRQLARTLRAMGVPARATPRAGVTPPHARLLATVSSPPMSVLLHLMDGPSDDLFADLLTEQLGAKLGGAGTISAGARVIGLQIGGYGVHPAIVDGSGLSRSDLSSPRDVTDLLTAVWGTPVGDGLRDALPIVGETGTVSQLAARTAAHGRCIAKTGTLTDVTNLAGYCYSRGHRQMLDFALFIDGPSNWKAYGLLSRMVAAIARY
jgi:D-alanyl-D-alanine carboxypeptidase/D-alanyl-D-alanine-endopeptidase (penicillin-binding protein 4)